MEERKQDEGSRAVTVDRQRTVPEGGIRSVDPFRDLNSVVDLIDVAFGEHLDPAGRATLARMRRFADGGPFLQWAWALLGKATVAPGLVWVVDDRIVGNVSVRRARHSEGYLIGNVVVHPEYRGRGIASALMRRIIRVISKRGARWVGLEVRVGNAVARGLYERLGFKEVGRTRHLLRASGSGEVERPSRRGLMRRGRQDDGNALVRLMKATIPREQRPLLEVQAADYRPDWTRRLEHWLRCEDELWWVIPGEQGILGAVRAVRRRGAFPHRMEIMVQPESNGRFEDALVRQGVSILDGSARKPIEIALPGATDPLLAALREVGFEELRVLIQMKRSLGRRVPVQRT